MEVGIGPVLKKFFGSRTPKLFQHTLQPDGSTLLIYGLDPEVYPRLPNQQLELRRGQDGRFSYVAMIKGNSNIKAHQITELLGKLNKKAAGETGYAPR